MTKMKIGYRIGDRIQAKNQINFADGTYHYKGQQFTVDETNIAYFNNFNNISLYKLIERNTKFFSYNVTKV